MIISIIAACFGTAVAAIIYALCATAHQRRELAERQAEVIRGAIDPAPGERRGYSRSTQGARPSDLTEGAHDEAFQAAWIDPAQEVIDRIDRELAPILREQKRAAWDEAWEAVGGVRIPSGGTYFPSAEAADEAEQLAKDGWRRERDGSLTQIARPVPTRPDDHLGPELEVEYEDIYDMHGTLMRRAIIRKQPEAFWRVP